ncbi:MAG: hypothetical protein WB586_00205 [Chthoniobacterales bacterium]
MPVVSCVSRFEGLCLLKNLSFLRKCGSPGGSPQIPILFGGFDRNEKVIRAVLESPAGHRVRERGAPEGRTAFGESLGKLMAGRSLAEKRQVIAVFRAIYSAPFWELLRKRGGLSGQDAISAAEWAVSTLIEGLGMWGLSDPIQGCPFVSVLSTASAARGAMNGGGQLSYASTDYAQHSGSRISVSSGSRDNPLRKTHNRGTI